jgi:hypothetical protein
MPNIKLNIDGTIPEQDVVHNFNGPVTVRICTSPYGEQYRVSIHNDGGDSFAATPDELAELARTLDLTKRLEGLAKLRDELKRDFPERLYYSVPEDIPAPLASNTTPVILGEKEYLVEYRDGIQVIFDEDGDPWTIDSLSAQGKMHRVQEIEPTFNDTGGTLRYLLAHRQKFRAIKLHRLLSGDGLVDSKKYVESL